MAFLYFGGFWESDSTTVSTIRTRWPRHFFDTLQYQIEHVVIYILGKNNKISKNSQIILFMPIVTPKLMGMIECISFSTLQSQIRYLVMEN